MYKKLPIPAIIFCLIFSAAGAQIVINEYSASNLTQFQDNFQKYEDFIELYNPTGSLVNLGGYHLSDDSTDATKWQFPNGVAIGANGFLRIWCSGRDSVNGTNIHAGFKLKQTKNNKEDIVFADPSGNILDGVRLAITQLGHSRGRTTDGGSDWGVFVNPTPGSTNNLSVSYQRYADKPATSSPAGFYSGTLPVIMTTTEPNATIYYTLDGTRPDNTSTPHTGVILLSNTTVVKGITYSSDPTILPSLIEFETFFINVSHTLPVVSVAANQLITLANGSGSLEPQGTFEYFDTSGTRKANTYGEFNRHGQDSWAHSQRSVDFISRDEMGYNHSVEHKIFEYSPRENFQRLILRAAGDDNYPADHSPSNLGSAHVRDAYVHMLAKKGGMNLDVRNAEKCIVYMNGQYWGVYDIRENPDEHDYTEYYYGQDKFNIYYILTWGSTWEEYGQGYALAEWNSLYNYIMTNSMADPVKYQYVIDRYDATSLVDYVLTNMFSVCSDWLNYNTGWWRGLNPNGQHQRWGYILWDNDATFGHYINYTGINNTNYTAVPCDVDSSFNGSDPKGHINVLNRLRMNPDFNNYYKTRSLDLWNTVFSCDNMLPQLDSIEAKLDPEMTQHASRWGGTYTEWKANINTLRNYIINRCNALTSGYMSCYNMTGPYDVTLDVTPAGSGNIQWNTTTISDFPWTGKYFGGVDMVMEALPEPTWYFSNWTAVTNAFNPSPTAPAAKVNLTATDSIVAHFSITSSVAVNSAEPVMNLYPTLTSSSTVLDYSLPEATPVTISLHSLLGDKVAVISKDQMMDKGFYSVNIDLASTSLPAGVYLINVQTKSAAKSMRVVYTK